ncbi:MAG: YraN family protein [Acidimicrobiales bacterium]
MTEARRSLGQAGEALVASWYEARGYEVLARNWRCRQGEIDLVLRRGEAVVICEVKARTTNRYGAPGEAVGPAKQARLRRLGLLWLAEAQPGPVNLRFDFAGVLAGRVDVIESAF